MNKYTNPNGNPSRTEEWLTYTDDNNFMMYPPVLEHRVEMTPSGRTVYLTYISYEKLVTTLTIRPRETIKLSDPSNTEEYYTQPVTTSTTINGVSMFKTWNFDGYSDAYYVDLPDGKQLVIDSDHDAIVTLVMKTFTLINSD